MDGDCRFGAEVIAKIAGIESTAKISKAPKSPMIQWKFAINAAPAAMKKIARITSAPRMPQDSTRCWHSCGTAKSPKIGAKTKMLPIESDLSIR
jgi:hypothetical protein